MRIALIASVCAQGGAGWGEEHLLGNQALEGGAGLFLHTAKKLVKANIWGKCFYAC